MIEVQDVTGQEINHAIDLADQTEEEVDQDHVTEDEIDLEVILEDMSEEDRQRDMFVRD